VEHFHDEVLELVPCNEIVATLNYTSLGTADLERSNLTAFLCPNNLPNPFVEGRPTADIFKTTRLDIKRCFQSEQEVQPDGSTITC